MPQAYAATLGYQIREDCARAVAEARQPVAGNRATRSGEVDNSCLAQGVQLSLLRQGHSNARREISKGKFSNPPHPKDGYFLPKCKDSRARRILEFVIPIFYPEKPARVAPLASASSLIHSSQWRKPHGSL